MKCKWCGGTGQRALHSPGCEHCNDTGTQVDPPWGQCDEPPGVINDLKVNELCTRLFAMKLVIPGDSNYYQSKLILLDAMSEMLCGETLQSEDRELLARFWSDVTCNDTYGDIFQRVASRVLQNVV